MKYTHIVFKYKLKNKYICIHIIFTYIHYLSYFTYKNCLIFFFYYYCLYQNDNFLHFILLNKSFFLI